MEVIQYSKIIPEIKFIIIIKLELIFINKIKEITG